MLENQVVSHGARAAWQCIAMRSGRRSRGHGARQPQCRRRFAFSIAWSASDLQNGRGAAVLMSDGASIDAYAGPRGRRTDCGPFCQTMPQSPATRCCWRMKQDDWGPGYFATKLTSVFRLSQWVPKNEWMRKGGHAESSKPNSIEA